MLAACGTPPRTSHRASITGACVRASHWSKVPELVPALGSTAGQSLDSLGMPGLTSNPGRVPANPGWLGGMLNTVGDPEGGTTELRGRAQKESH